jgi:hypothetical protein
MTQFLSIQAHANITSRERQCWLVLAFYGQLYRFLVTISSVGSLLLVEKRIYEDTDDYVYCTEKLDLRHGCWWSLERRGLM